MMNTDYRPTNSWDFRLRAAKVGGMSVRSLATLTLTVALIALLATLATLLATPLQAQSLHSFVDNKNQSVSSDSDDFQAQSFETGANENGYTVSQVDIQLDDVSGKSTSVKIRQDDGGEPGNLVATLVNPGTLTSYQFNTFTAQPVITLAASTTYWITVNEGITSDRMPVLNTSADDEFSAWDWSIGDSRLHRTDETDSWTPAGTSLLITIWGTIDAELSDLTLEGADGSETITLSPVFAVNTYTYTAAVVNQIDTVKLTATKNDDNDTVVITNDDDDSTAGEALLDLSVGYNTLTVTVTAQNGAALTYTVTVERLAVPPPEVMVPSDWGLIPSDLDTGDQFRLLFLSSTDTDATSADIADYNTFIQNLAATGHADIQDYRAGFRAVGCTAAVNARNNTGTTGAGVPIYWLNGSQVADDYADFYDGNWDDEANDKNESGNNGPDTSLEVNHPFTGCDHDGTGAVFGASSRALGASQVRLGRPNAPGATDGPLGSSNVLTSSESRPMYGLSQVFEVPIPTISLVSNTHLSATASNNLFEAQSFETGANAGGYTVSEVDIRFGDVSGTSTSVKIRENNADNQPGDLVATLTNPGTLTSDSLNTFTAQPVITLDASTTYWLTVNEGISSNRTRVFYNDENDQTGEAGWSIGDGHLTRTTEMQAWVTFDSSLLMAIKGTAIPPTTLVSNTHLSATFRRDDFQAQSFETGANPDGYTVSEVDIRFDETSARSTSVKIRKNNADNEPGDLVATLTNPGTLTSNSLNTFMAQDVITLAASTTYWITVNEGISSNRARVFNNAGNGQTGETGWTIGNGHLWKAGENECMANLIQFPVDNNQGHRHPPHLPGKQHASEVGTQPKQHHHFSSEIRNGHQLGWLHGLRG